MTRDLIVAYLCWLPPQGLFGAHLIYLRRPWLALLYSCTLGCFVIGWLTDGLFLRSLVASTAALPPPVPSSSLSLSSLLPSSTQRDLTTLLVLYCSLGLLGAHRLYCGEPWIALLYLLSFGLLGFGALSDSFQLTYLLDRAQHPLAYERYSLFTAYQLLLPPFGLLGLHQFYLGRNDRGWWYAATVGALGLAVLRDVFTLPTQVREANEEFTAHQLRAEDAEVSSNVSVASSSLPFPLPSLASYRRARAALSAAVQGPPRCVACMQAPINTVFLDCGHSVFCIQCAHTFVDFAHAHAEGADTQQASGGNTRGGQRTGGGGGGRGRASSSSASLLPSPAVSLPCAICRSEIREIKQIYVSSSS